MGAGVGKRRPHKVAKARCTPWLLSPGIKGVALLIYSDRFDRSFRSLLGRLLASCLEWELRFQRPGEDSLRHPPHTQVLGRGQSQGLHCDGRPQLREAVYFKRHGVI